MQPASHAERKHARISGSKVARLMACPGSAPLSDFMPDEPSEHASRGTAAHELGEWCLLDHSRKLQDRLGDTIEVDGQSFEIDQKMIDDVALYVDLVREVEILEGATIFLEAELDGGEDYPDAGGLADCIAEYGTIGEDATPQILHVIDYKNGVVPVTADENMQLMTYALLRDPNLTFETYRFTIVQPNSSDGSEPVKTWECDRSTMAEFVLSFSNMYEEVNESASWITSPEAAMKHPDFFKEGDHCRFCPCVSQCPAKLQKFADAENLSELNVDLSVESTWPDIRQRVLDAESSILDLIKAVKGRAYDELMAGEEVPGYKLVQGRAGDRKWADEEQALKVLSRQKIGKKIACETRIKSPTRLEKDLGKETFEQVTAGLVVRSEGKLTMAPESDKREAVAVKSAKDAFADAAEVETDE